MGVFEVILCQKAAVFSYHPENFERCSVTSQKPHQLAGPELSAAIRAN